MKDGDPMHKPALYAAAAASLLMLAFGISYRVLAARLEGPVTTTPISPAAVAQFPMQIGDWSGREVPIDDAVVRATDTDAHISRQYSRRGGLEAVSFYVACGVRARDLMPHRPEVCYTGAGWTVVEHHVVELAVPDGNNLPCSVYQFSRGALRAERVLVLYYYLVDGRYCQDVSLLRSQAWRGSGTVGYVAQVQVMTPVASASDAQAARERVSTFAVESARATADLFKHASTLHDPNKPHDVTPQP